MHATHVGRDKSSDDARRAGADGWVARSRGVEKTVIVSEADTHGLRVLDLRTWWAVTLEQPSNVDRGVEPRVR